MTMHVIDYEIFGAEMQYVEIELDPGEAAIGEAGVMMYMENGITMDTIFGDGSQQGGFFGKLMGVGKRLLTGEGLFTTVFQNDGNVKQRVACAAPYPGKIVPIDLRQLGGTLICQKDSFCALPRGGVGHCPSAQAGCRFVWWRRLHHAKARGRWHGLCPRRWHPHGAHPRPGRDPAGRHRLRSGISAHGGL